MENDVEFINCTKCGKREKLICSLQEGTTPFIILGESPAKDGWIESKRAFYNTKGKLQASGRVLEKLLNNIGYSINDIYFTEMCKCILFDRKELDSCIKNCFPFLVKQLLSLNSSVKIIVTMGKNSTQAFLNKKIKTFSEIVGSVTTVNIEGREFILLPIYHPSPLNPLGYKGNETPFNTLKELTENNCCNK